MPVSLEVAALKASEIHIAGIIAKETGNADMLILNDIGAQLLAGSCASQLHGNTAF